MLADLPADYDLVEEVQDEDCVQLANLLAEEAEEDLTNGNEGSR